MKVSPTEELPWKTVVVNARVGHVQNKYVRKVRSFPALAMRRTATTRLAGRKCSPHPATTMILTRSASR
jgi:hypothetical protein